MATILGIDPGLTRLGVGIISHHSGRTVSLVHVEVLRTPSTDLPEARLGALSEALENILDFHQPDMVALERVFAQQNLRTVMGTAQISGVVLALAHRRSLPVSMRTPSEVKAAVTGYGRADKKQVGTMVQKILGLDDIPQPADAADALALAISEAWRGGGSPVVATAGETPAQKAWREAEGRAGQPKLKE